MKEKLFRSMTLLFMMVSAVAFAQGDLLKGTVNDQDGVPLPGANISVKGTEIGTQTDFEGNFEIEVENGQTLVFSYLGMKSKEIVYDGQEELAVTLESNPNQLDEVVVTALGITREKKSLGYATQDVGGDALTETRNANAINSLSGRVAGVQITNASANLGGSSRILIRGAGSITQENKPLFVVDGVPLANDNFNSCRYSIRWWW